MQVKHVVDERVVGCVMLHLKPGALVWWSAENSQVSVTQFQIRESTDIHQSQGLRILTDFLKPEVTVGTVVKFQVFYSRMTRIHVDAQLVVCGLASIFDTEAKVDYIIIGPKSFS